MISSVRGSIRQTGSAKLDRPISAELLVVNRRFLSQFRVPGETGSAKLAPPIWLGDLGSAILKLSVGGTSPSYLLEIEGLFTEG